MASVDPGAPEMLRFGCFELNCNSRELRKNGSRVRLDGQPLLLLELLVEHCGDIVTREQVRQKLWGEDTFVDFEHSINAAVKRLRQALDDSAETPRFIETVPRRGYRFIYPLHSTPLPAEAGTPAPARRFTLLGGRVVAVAVLVAALIMLTDVVGLHSTLFARKHAIHSLAVVPFENLSRDSSDEYLADGITEELIAELSQISSLNKVSSRTSAMAYKGTQKTTHALGKELGVDALVEGSVMREGDRLRIEVQLIDAVSDQRLMHERYNESAASILGVQAEIARRIAREVDATLSPRQEARLAKRSSVNPEAYDAYLKARYLNAKWSAGRGNLETAIKFYDRAIQMQPDFAAAYAGKSMAQFFLAAALMEFEPPPGVIPSARAAAEKAMQIDPESAEANEALGWYLHNHAWDFAGAERAYRKAIALNPNYAPPYVWLGHVLQTTGRASEAPPLAARAYALDPLSPHIQWSLAEAYMVAGNFPSAERETRELVALHADFWPAYALLGNIYLWQRDYQHSIDTMKQAVEVSHRHPYALGMLASAYALAGRRNEALGVVRELNELRRTRYVAPPVMVRAYASLRDRQHAIEWLKKAYEEHCNETPRVPLWGPVVAGLRGYAPYEALLHNMNVSDAALRMAP